MPHIASTLTNSTRYTDFERAGDGSLIEKFAVTVNGGFGLANKNFITPQGAVLTQVSDEEAAFLMKHQQFKDHMKGGFVKVLAKSQDGEKVAADMDRADKSQPLSPASFKEKVGVEDLSVSTGPVAH